MSWSVPSVFLVGQVLRALDMNNISTDLTWLYNGGLTPIYDSTFSAVTFPAASIDITSIPSTWAHLILTFEGRGDTGSAPTLLVRINNDSGSNYDTQRKSSQATAVTAAESLGTNIGQLGNIPAVSDVALAAGLASATFPGYSSTTLHKTMKSLNTYKTATSSGGVVEQEYATHYRSASAISRLTLSLGSGSFVAGTRVTLYGQGAPS